MATGENLFSMQDARNLIRYGGMRPDRDWLQFDCALSYGLVEYLRTLEMLKEHGWSAQPLHPARRPPDVARTSPPASASAATSPTPTCSSRSAASRTACKVEDSYVDAARPARHRLRRQGRPVPRDAGPLGLTHDPKETFDDRNPAARSPAPPDCCSRAGLAASSMASAAYPDKPITLIVPFSAGGPSDKIARDIAEAMRKPLGGQNIVIDNTVGAGGTIGTAKMLRAPADGYTLLIHHVGLATAPALYKKLGYKDEDLEFIGLINEAPSTLIGTKSLPATNVAELRKYIAANDGKVTLANAGVGSASHLCGLMLQSAFKSNMIFVPYKGTGPAMNDLLGGQVELMCEQATNSTPQIKATNVKAFGVTSAQRMTLPDLAKLPTLAESGLPGLRLPGLARPVRAEGHAAGRARQAQRRVAGRPEGSRPGQARGSTGPEDRRRRAPEPGRRQEVLRERSRALGQGDQGRRHRAGVGATGLPFAATRSTCGASQVANHTRSR